MFSVDDLKARIDALKQQRDGLRDQFHQVEGAIRMLSQMLEEKAADGTDDGTNDRPV